MAEKVSVQKLASLLSKKTVAKINPANIIASQIGGAVQKDLEERFNYDFVNLGIKLFVYFGIMFAFAKFMEAVIFAKGAFTTIANLFGFSIPTSDQVPQTLKDLFDGGINGVKFWDLVKILAILLVIAEFMRYMNSNQGAKSSPMTIGIFISIIVVLGATTVFDLRERLKTTFNNPQEFV